MATLAVQRVTASGLTPTFAAASSGGDNAPVASGRVLLVKNGSGSSINVTMTTPGNVEGVAVADPVLAVAAGAVGAIPMSSIYRGTDGTAAIAYSSATTVTVALLQLS